MIKPFMLLSTTVSTFLLCLPADAIDPRNMPGNSSNRVMVGNDLNRKALSGFNVLGGGAKPVDPAYSKQRAVNPVVSTLTSAQVATLKRDADTQLTEATTLQKQGKIPEAIAAMRRSLEIRDRYFATTDSNIPVMKQKVAEMYLAIGKPEESIYMLKDAMSAYGRLNGQASDQRIKPLVMIGDICLKKGDHRQAIDSYNQAYILAQRSKGASSPEAMRLRLQLAAANGAAKSYETSAALYNECFDLQKKNEKLIERDTLLASMQDCANVLKELKRDDEARAMLARVEELRGNAGSKSDSDGSTSGVGSSNAGDGSGTASDTSTQTQ